AAGGLASPQNEPVVGRVEDPYGSAGGSGADPGRGELAPPASGIAREIELVHVGCVDSSFLRTTPLVREHQHPIVARVVDRDAVRGYDGSPVVGRGSGPGGVELVPGGRVARGDVERENAVVVVIRRVRSEFVAESPGEYS